MYELIGSIEERWAERIDPLLMEMVEELTEAFKETAPEIVDRFEELRPVSQQNVMLAYIAARCMERVFANDEEPDTVQALVLMGLVFKRYMVLKEMLVGMKEEVRH